MLDADRIHAFPDVLRTRDRALAAASEQLTVNVDLALRVSAPSPEDRARNIRNAREAHSAQERQKQAVASAGADARGLDLMDAPGIPACLPGREISMLPMALPRAAMTSLDRRLAEHASNMARAPQREWRMCGPVIQPDGKRRIQPWGGARPDGKGYRSADGDCGQAIRGKSPAGSRNRQRRPTPLAAWGGQSLDNRRLAPDRRGRTADREQVFPCRRGARDMPSNRPPKAAKARVSSFAIALDADR